MDIKLPTHSGPTTSNAAAATAPELPASLQQLPRGTLLTAVVQSSTAAPTQSQAAVQTQPVSTQAANQSQNRTFNVLLNISGNQVPTQSNYAFTTGQLLKVEITANATLRVVEVATKQASQLDSALLQIQQGLRQALPIQQSPKLLLNNLTSLFQLLEQTSAGQTKMQIRELLATIPDLKQLSNPVALKSSVHQSGIFLEAKIKQLEAQVQQLLKNGPAQKSSNQSSQSHPATNSAQHSSSHQTTSRSELLQNLLKNNVQLSNQLEKLVGQDFKAQLLKLSGNLIPLLNRANSGGSANPAEAALIQRILQALPTTQGTGGLTDQSNRPLPLSNLPINTQLKHLLNPSLAPDVLQPSQQQAAANHSNKMDMAVSTVLRQIAASLAQVQANQLHSLTGPRADTDGGQLLNSWHTEIPVFLDGQFKPIQLLINEERNPEASAQDSEKSRVWKITLGFDFEELGEFFATLKIINTSVSATFWSDQPQTLQRISSELQHLNTSLRKLGLNVEELECRRGKPIIRETRLDRQLVDIKT